MLGLAGLIDNLLTAKGSPPLDVAALQRGGGVAAPGAVQPAGTVNNDVRLPSNAALDRLVPGSRAPLTTPAPGVASARPDLSVAARAISVVLAQLHGDAGPVRSTAPAWPTTQAPLPAMLANALAQAVSDSGLFYESHLAQFAEGTRSAAQMLREPQARWGTPAPASAAGLPANGRALAAPLLETAGADTPATQGETGPVARAAVGAAPPHDKLNGAPPAAADAAEPAALAPADADAQRVQAAYRHGEARPAVAIDMASASPSPQGADARAAAGASAGPVIHPQGMTLVHQQLDLLATDAFRWSGQAWPGVPMTWTIEAEPERDQDRAAHGAAAEEGRRAWSTTVAMNLPHLGAVDIHLSLDGHGLQARLQAGEAATATRLRSQGAALTQRLEAAGLRLQAFQVDAKGAA